MPTIIDYPTVLTALAGQGLRCLYHNSGAFGFDPAADISTTGWITQDDPSIRPAALRQVTRCPAPADASLITAVNRLWPGAMQSNLWIMPASHWAYELEFGNADWLPDALSAAGIDSEALRSRNNGSAIEFTAAESAPAIGCVSALLRHLSGSDFTLAFPNRPVVCLVHHHKQLWWQTTDTAAHQMIQTAGRGPMD